MQRERPIGVIGGGLGGLAAACTLAARGYAVVLFERNEWFGGKAAVYEADGYRFDMGPTILTVPSVLRRIFAEAGRELSDFLDLVPLDPQWRCFFDDGSVLDLHAQSDTMAEALRDFSPGAGLDTQYDRFLTFSQRLHDISNRYFFWRSIGSLRDMFDPRSTFQLSALAELLRMKPGYTVAGAVRHYVRDERVAQLVDHFTQYVGSAPDASPAVLCGIAHMQTSEGVWYPRGGTAAIPRALVRLGESLGVEFHTGQAVKRIEVHRETVCGVELDDGQRVPLAAALRAGLFGGRPVPGARSGVRPLVAPQLRVFGRSARRVRVDLPTRRAGRRPDVLRLCSGP